MRHHITIITGFAIIVAVFMIVYGRSSDLSLSDPSVVNTADKQSKPNTPQDNQTEPEEDVRLWLDTVLYAHGHALAYSGVAWYIDTVCIGTDNILRYDIVGPSILKLSLVTREITFNIGDSGAIERIKNFMNPIDGFTRF